MAEQRRRANVMVSYAVEDSARVDQLLKLLKRHEIPYFEFRRGIKPGENIINQVVDAIDRCTHVLIYASAASVDSQWVWFEVGIGVALRRSLVFVLDHPRTKLPLPFSHLRHVTSKKEFEELVQSLAFEGVSSNITDREMTPVENVAKGRLYYHEGGWASAIRLWGAEDVLFSRNQVSLDYRHIPLRIPPELQQTKKRAITEQKKEAARSGTVLFNGPNTRLLGFRVSPTDENAAIEIEHMTLNLGPVSWYDYMGLNEAFREQLKTSAPVPAYEYYVGLRDLADHGDVSKSRLSNIVETCASIITRDGYLMYGERTRRVVGPGKLTSAVAENISRYLDDTSLSGILLNPTPQGVNDLPDVALDARYVPVGVPDPFSAVRRGLSSEVSPRVSELIPDSAIKISGIAFDLEIFHPTLLFCIFAPLSRNELLDLYRREPGRETYEVVLHSTKASSSDKSTVSLFCNSDWVQSGKAAAIRALEVIESIRLRRECSFSEAFLVAAK